LRLKYFQIPGDREFEHVRRSTRFHILDLSGSWLAFQIPEFGNLMRHRHAGGSGQTKDRRHPGYGVRHSLHPRDNNGPGDKIKRDGLVLGDFFRTIFKFSFGEKRERSMRGRSVPDWPSTTPEAGVVPRHIKNTP
jgi:hypothetical protein